MHSAKNTNKTSHQALLDKLELDEKIKTKKGTFYKKQCNCGKEQLVPDGVCNVKCIRCSFSFIDC